MQAQGIGLSGDRDGGVGPGNLPAVQVATDIDRRVSANDLWLTGWILLEQGDVDQAEIQARDSWEIGHQLGEQYTQASAESVWVDVLVMRGVIGAAFEMFDQAIPGKIQRRRALLQHLVLELPTRGCPSPPHLAQALEVSERTIAQDLAALKCGHPIK